MAEMSRAQHLLKIIEQMDLESEPQFSLKGGAPGYRYQDRGQGQQPGDQYMDGKRPSGLQARAGRSA